MSTLDDLLSQRRRAPLSDADERRVQIGVKSSLDHQLALLASQAFDRDGAPQRGDTELVRKIVRQVEGEWSGTFQRQAPARPKWSRWAAVPTLIAGVAAASWGGGRLLQALREAPSLQVGPAPTQAAVTSSSAGGSLPQPALAGSEVGLALRTPEPAPLAVPEAALLSPPLSSPAPQPRVARSAHARSAGSAHARSASSAQARSAAPILLRPAAPRAVPRPEVAGSALPPELQLSPDDTARSLFVRATQLRRDDWTSAATLYELLTQRFASSTEAGVAQMALGKHALDEGHASDALRWFRAYQLRPSGELTSEALWGEARALESLGENAAARAVWRKLVTDYPGSAYAAVARQQLGS